ncbi:hypothetical protein Clocel_1474 [Clostridium cellulovorans 743B]|uniref:Uncharacterized protein n=1 Tax=Clostridium cellulovorans (strain ATCC 35296 / DSM 3052 / OCM 3 / 743B) TaxID=573061 RepID=D9SW81_CLOC7|nr:hypothetical protein Clocel_1474 [Clostridium cellulovorans 743B]
MEKLKVQFFFRFIPYEIESIEMKRELSNNLYLDIEGEARDYSHMAKGKMTLYVSYKLSLCLQ